jgi:hypothetical protein
MIPSWPETDEHFTRRVQEESVRTSINTDHAVGPFLSHFNGTGSFATTEVDHNFPYNPGKEVRPHPNGELRLSFVRAPATATGGPEEVYVSNQWGHAIQ